MRCGEFRARMRLKEAADVACKRSVFDICSEHAKKTSWADFVSAMQGRWCGTRWWMKKEWEQLNGMFA